MAKKPLITRFSAGNLPKYGRKKAPDSRSGLLHLFNAWQFPTLAWGGPTLPSALRRFTSEFGMGSGGTTALLPPGKFWCAKRIFFTDAALPVLAKSVTYSCMLLPFLRPAASPQRKILRTRVRRTKLILYPSQAENSFGLSDQNASGVVRLSLTGH